MYLCCCLTYGFSFLGGGELIFNFRVSFFSLDLVLFFKHVNIHNFQKLNKLYWHDIFKEALCHRPSTICPGPTHPGLCFPSGFVSLFYGIKGTPVLWASCWLSACPDSPFCPAHLAAPGVHLGGWSWAQASHSL